MDTAPNSNSLAQILLPTKDLTLDMAFFSKIGFQLDNIFPSDDPAVAFMSGHGMHLRIDKSAQCAPAILHLLTNSPEILVGEGSEITAPNGSRIKILPRNFQLETPATQHKFEIRQLRDSDAWVIGRAGMLYRDLVPDRLGGSIIASHIRIPVGGPVPDMVHFHSIGFQLIFCYKGWVKLVYEDQGPPFILHAGDCVTQPPEIRHQVLEASDNLEVIEIGVPAEHMTTIDHEMTLPTSQLRPDRLFKGQRFCHHKAAGAIWQPWRIKGFEYRETGISQATQGVASVQVARPAKTNEQPQLCSHDTDMLFSFVTQGNLELWSPGFGVHKLNTGDAFVLPPKQQFQISNISADLELLEVALPGSFNTLS